MRLRLGHVNVVLLALLGLLLLFYGQELAGARRQAVALLNGGLPTPVPRQLEQQAVTLLRARGETAEARKLLERAIDIDPNASALYVLADLTRMEGDLEGALELHLRYSKVDPSYYPVYLSIAGIYERLGRAEERTAILTRGRDRLAELVEGSVPRADDSVDAVANGKAEAVHQFYREGLFRIRSALGEAP